MPTVRALFHMVSQLPPFAWSTKRLPQAALAVRQAFQNGRSPEQFLFVLIPEALGLPPVADTGATPQDVERLFTALNTTLRTWSETTPQMVAAARDTLLNSCGLPPGLSGWNGLRRRALAMEPSIAEPHLRAFLQRVAQTSADTAGVEAALGLVANRPPSTWSDDDADRFPQLAGAIGQSFREATRQRASTPTSDTLLGTLSAEKQVEAEALLQQLRSYLRSGKQDRDIEVVRAVMHRLLEEMSE